MPRKSFVLGTLAFLFFLASTDLRSADQTLIAPGSVWRYNDSGANLGTGWRSRTFNDSAWPSGAAQLGYGDGDEATVISYGSNPNNRRITYYFRRGFAVTDPSAITALTVRFMRDDGGVVYLNGVEVVRSNMPSGTITSSTRATTAVSGAAESAWTQTSVSPSLLVSGTNVIAVEVHQQSPSSTDVTFDLELLATMSQVEVPTVSLLAPANNSVSNTTDVSFTASVAAASGLSSATLFVGDAPTTVTFSGPADVEDAQITADTPTLANGTALQINVDGQSPHAHALLKVPALIGSGLDQVPLGAIVTSAFLSVNCTNSGQAMRAYRLTQSWSEDSATWNERSPGLPWGSPGADGTGANAGVALTADCTTTGLRQFDLTSFVQEWSGGQPNHGIVLVDAGTDGIDFDSSESTSSPLLTVVYRTDPVPVETQQISGLSAEVSFSAELDLGRTYRWNVLVEDTQGQKGVAPSDFELTVDASSPNAPVLVSPLDGATGVGTSPTLRALVSDPGGSPLNVNIAVRPAAAPEFTIIALPDTQHYAEQHPEIFTAQTQWIVNNTTARNIVFVTHEGDLVQHNNVDQQWQRANTSMSLLDGVVPYGMGPGNHDQPTTLYNQYFPYTRYQGVVPWYGGHYQNLNDNNYQLFSAGGMDFVIVHLQFCPPSGAVAWADSVFKSYPDRIGMMTTHGYLGLGAVRSVHACGSTQYLWDGLSANPNLRFMLSGHVHGEARRTDIVGGRTVFQMLADYQDRENGGDGWLRILRFVPAEDTIYVQTYSPTRNQFETDADSEFTLDFEMGGAFASVGSTVADSETIASIPAGTLAPNTTYEWQVTVTNHDGKTRVGPVWRFTTGTGGPPNQPPVAVSQSVSATEDTSRILSLGATDPEGSPLVFSVVAAPLHGTLSGVAPSLIYQPAANYNGPDSFTFRASDGQALSNLATVTIDVQAQNDPPVAVNEFYVVASGGVLSIATPGVLGNDTDIDSGSLQAQLGSGPSNGALTLNSNGAFTYTPGAGYSGPDSFTYRASDGVATSGLAVVSVTVNPPADTTPPVRSNGGPSGTLPLGTTQTTLVLTTSEAATCRQATTPGVAYASMPTVFTTTGGTAHARQVTGLTNGSSYAFYVRCQDGSGNANANDFAITFAVAADTSAPQVTVTSPAVGSTVSGTVTVAATASDNVAVVGVQFLVDGAAVGAEDTTAPYSVSWNTTSVPNGPHQVAARARDAAGNLTTAAAVTVPVNNTIVTPPAGLIAAYSFNAGSGTTLADVTGKGHTGTVSGAAWTTSGRFGNALSFDGVNDWVTIADANDLDFTTGMTLEAWVRPTASGGYRTVIYKESPDDFAYLLSAGATPLLPLAAILQAGSSAELVGGSGLALNTWAHLAVTYDGSLLSLYVNGVLAASAPASGSILQTTGVLRLGGNGIWAGQFFQGQIDEVRLYNRGLAPAEIQADMLAPLAP